MAASVAGVVRSSWIQFKDNEKKQKRVSRVKIYCSSSSSSVKDSYKTLRIQPGASESEVKKAFRQLALQFHPDVCRESNSGVQFHQIIEAYDIVMENLRGAENRSEMHGGGGDEDGGNNESNGGKNVPDWDLWEEWMGWEGAGIRDYSSHINPYI
ncbi:hypothetical protein K1719_029175 [Acacia pycnantha]|nr:hypothetical protein K1719_029175 [Acacia pycnantha]